jgi:2-polyprenyl-3-methyl-5-hydroxy-6-metoxy-1,4-benzoquinol methylase
VKHKKKPQTEYVPCPLCQSYDYQKFLTKFEMNLVKCRKCSLIYANPRIQESELFCRYTNSFFYDEYLPAFKAASTHYDLKVIRSHFFIFIQLITKYFKPGKRLLDVGCGSGFFLKAAEEIGWEAEGVEISPVASEYAQNIVRVKVLEGKLEAYHLPPEKYDLVVLIETIEHLTNPLDTLREIYRILKKEGILIISTPDSKSLSRLFLGKNWAVFSPEEHLSVFSQKNLFYLLHRANFCVLGIRNLLQLNPEYTHKKKGFGYLVFKKLYNILEKIKIMEKATLFEYADLMNIEEKNHLKAKSVHSHLNLTKKIKRKVHKWAKIWIRGDTLIEIAKKI